MKTAKTVVSLGGRGKLALFAALLFAWSAEAAQPHISQNISLIYGWNAVYVEVSPELMADELFANWPVDNVGLYDPASFLATRQFSANWTSQGLPKEAMLVWYRGVPEASSLKSVPAGSVLVVFCKQDSFITTLRGLPAPPRITWHVTGTDKVYNFVGFSVTERTSITAYLEGSPCENVQSVGYYRIIGDDPGAAPDARAVRSWSSEGKVSDGDVLLLPSDKLSDWSGVLHVSPLGGIDFGQTDASGRLSIRNDGTTNRTVRIVFDQPVNQDDLFGSIKLPTSVWMRDADAAITNSVWELVEHYGTPKIKTLAPGETWNLDIGLDRKTLQNGDLRKGLGFGALLKITEDSAAHAKAIIPIYGETSGEDAAAWQNGLWVADVELDTIQMMELIRVVRTNVVEGVEVVSTNALETALGKKSPTGGKFKLRLPIHRDREGRTRLLQRVVAAGSTSADGTFSYKLYAGSATPPDTSRTLMRISAVCLPTELPIVEATGGDLWDYQETEATKFGFTVAPDGATSLLRHPYHPQHDGLRWDFKTLAPSGDDVNNYKYDVKPETFSVKSEIRLKIDHSDEGHDWDPQQMFDGTCEWSISGLRHDGNVVVSGTMVLKLVAPNAQLVVR